VRRVAESTERASVASDGDRLLGSVTPSTAPSRVLHVCHVSRPVNVLSIARFCSPSKSFPQRCRRDGRIIVATLYMQGLQLSKELRPTHVESLCRDREVDRLSVEHLTLFTERRSVRAGS
jgi:hypothetical protein